MTTFDNTRAAMLEYEMSRGERNRAWERVQTSSDIEACEESDHLALQAVQDAFYEDTKMFNTEAFCRSLHYLMIYRQVPHPKLNVDTSKN
jgi:hypothetical protein